MEAGMCMFFSPPMLAATTAAQIVGEYQNLKPGAI